MQVHHEEGVVVCGGSIRGSKIPSTAGRSVVLVVNFGSVRFGAGPNRIVLNRTEPMQI